MSNEFEQISIKPGFMKHNGGVLFRAISENEYEFKSIINENHLNAAGITHGGYLLKSVPIYQRWYLGINSLFFIAPGIESSILGLFLISPVLFLQLKK